ncbi:hypothetical protein L596_010536 [Steinernema carpocapsae]|uniref:EGF-like domain-containing protein n=1 Tax=Steinernema carpocapsae TaxID=34508 RepID=A0A4U5PJ59_STECR|nr:hypothetical protein L596_010536 [Steinernema carpocapsae]
MLRDTQTTVRTARVSTTSLVSTRATKLSASVSRAPQARFAKTVREIVGFALILKLVEDDCVDKATKRHKCRRRDKYATCEDRVNDYECQCSKQWRGRHCTVREELWVHLQRLNLYDDNTIAMLEEILDNPEMIHETVPFFLALMPSDNQTQISWEYGDLFEWASFEGNELSVKKDIKMWNAATLGNCFTFNHAAKEKFSLKYGGEREGFRALLKIQSEHYLPWIDTASLLVFVHSHTESVFGESVRFQAKPGGQTTIITSLSTFERLGGGYGKCVVDKSEVKSYYYKGDYTVDDAVFQACKCMDPRFPLKDGTKRCDLSEISCVSRITNEQGDPSNWPDCDCPLPCSSGQYNVHWSHLDLMDCNGTVCPAKDQVLISVQHSHMIQNTFREEPKVDFNKFIANLGGLLGILCGVCVITLIEFVFLLAHILYALIFMR